MVGHGNGAVKTAQSIDFSRVVFRYEMNPAKV